MNAPETPTRSVRVVTVGAVLLVAAVAAVVSYVHMQEVARDAGEGWRSLLLPLSVDGLVVAASMVLVTRRRAGLPGGWLAWRALLGGVGASLAANVAAAEPTITAQAVAAWPAAAFAIGIELLLQQGRVPVADPVDALSVEVVEPVVEDSPAAHPVDDDLGDVDEQAVEVDPPTARIAELVRTAHTEGRPVGRRTLARELGVTEYRAGQLLTAANNG